MRVEHVVRALLDDGGPRDPTVDSPAIRRAHAAGLSVGMVVAAADDELAALPSLRSYRGADATIERDGELETLLERLRGGWRLVSGPADGGAFVDAFLLTRRGAEWTELCAIDTRPVQELISRVRDTQARWAAPALSAEHVLLALLEEQPFARALARLGGDRRGFREHVRSRLLNAPDKCVPTLIEAILASAVHFAQNAREDELDVHRFAQAVLADSRVRPIFEGSGIDGYDLFVALVHPESADDEDAEHGPFAIRVFNDHFSRVDWVAELLTSIFELDLETAQRVTLYVHHEGEAILVEPDDDGAITKVAMARAFARERWMPLRMVLGRAPIEGSR